jgi:hypothetical protein
MSNWGEAIGRPLYYFARQTGSIIWKASLAVNENSGPSRFLFYIDSG